MKISKILAPFLALLLLNSTFSTNFILKASSNDKKLSNYVCKIIKDITKSKSVTQDVLIGNLREKMWSSTINDIAGCVGDGNGVVVSDFKEALTEKTLRKATLMILTLKDYNLVSTFSYISPTHHSNVPSYTLVQFSFILLQLVSFLPLRPTSRTTRGG